MSLKFNAANNRLMIIIPEETKKWVYHAAKREKRSLSNFMLMLIEKAKAEEAKAA